MTENDVKTAVIEYLTLRGWLVLRVNSGAVASGDEGKRRLFWFVRWFELGNDPQTAGVADVLAFKPGCKPLAVETKAPGRESRVTQAQKDFLASWAYHGGQWCVVSDLSDLIAAIEG